MRIAPVVFSAVVSLVGCKKAEPTPNNKSTAEAPVLEVTPNAGTAPRTAKLPDLRSTVRTGGAMTNLPKEANPPGAPVISGRIEVDRDVRYIDEKVGTGAAPVSGKPISVHYTGWLTEGPGTAFDSSRDRGEPIKFNFDGGQVIKGWDIGLSSMKVGGKRRLIIPADLAYGERAMGDVIPAGSMLVFDVELMGVED